MSKNSNSSKDRAASAEDMNKLKDLISQKTVPAPVKPETPISNSVSQKPTPLKEVPEEVLRKVLE